MLMIPLIILHVDDLQLVFLKELLLRFGLSSGLKINYGQSNIIPINVPQEKIPTLLDALNCQQGSLPFTYLGLPLSTTKPRKEFFMFLLLSAQRSLSTCSLYLSYSDKLGLVNSMLSSLSTFYLRTLKVY
jgi:hypothetical protein